MNLPNALSLLRFPLAVLFPLLEALWARSAIVAAAAATDWIDGRVARARGQTTRAGELLDPVADKTFVATALLTLAFEGLLPLWTLPLLLIRDIGVAAGALVLALRGVRIRMPARHAGKIVTWLQFAGIALILLWPSTARWVAAIVAVAGLLALRDYGRAARRQLPGA